MTAGSLTALAPDPGEADADAVLEAFEQWLAAQGLTAYPHQEEAVLELLAGEHVVLGTPTGSGKSLVATAACFAALARGEVAWYTAPVKALVSEKFFAMCEVFGADRVGMLTGDAAVNPGAPVICCTAEVLANVALREGDQAAVGTVVMDEFHYYADPQRGWAWQVPLLELTHAQFVLMSATLGDVSAITAELERRTGRRVAVLDDAPRPVPLDFTWSRVPVGEQLVALVTGGYAPVYVVHFTQREAVAHATGMLGSLPPTSSGERLTTLIGRVGLPAGEQRDRIAEQLRDVRFTAGFGRTLHRLLRQGIGVHHAGMLPRYRRLVEQLAQQGLLTVICGTDTLGVGINVPIRTVLLTGLVKFDGHRERVLRTREFHQVAGRAGRAGFDTAGHVVVQAPEHVIENERALRKAGDDPKKRKKVQRRTPPDGTVVWTEQTFEKLVHGTPETLRSQLRVDNSLLLNVAARAEDGFAVVRRLLEHSHETRRGRLRLQRRALRLARGLVRSGVLTRRDTPDQHGRRYVLTEELPEDFALNQPLAPFALAALDALDPGSPDYALDVVSVVEAVLEAPRPVLLAQQRAARDAVMAEARADGLEYDERMALLDATTWPQPLAELLEGLYAIYRESHPWLPEDGLGCKSVVREMFETGRSFTDYVTSYELARSEGLLLRYLTDAYRTLQHTVPEAYRTAELDELVGWLGETVRQTDSSLLDEWESLTSGAPPPRPEDPPAPPRPLTATPAFRVMVRNAMFAKVQLVARDDVDGLAALEREHAARPEPAREPLCDAAAWDAVLEEYFAEHASVDTGPDARAPGLFLVEETQGPPPGGDPDAAAVPLWWVTQVLHDPAEHHDWVIEAWVDLPASDATGEPLLLSVGLRCR